MRLGTTRLCTLSDRYSNDSQSGAGGSVLQAGGQTCLVAHLAYVHTAAVRGTSIVLYRASALRELTVVRVSTLNFGLDT